MNEPRWHLIPAPTGALSRPHAGGYTLSAALGWENERYSLWAYYTLSQMYIYALVKPHLNFKLYLPFHLS